MAGRSGPAGAVRGGGLTPLEQLSPWTFFTLCVESDRKPGNESERSYRITTEHKPPTVPTGVRKRLAKLGGVSPAPPPGRWRPPGRRSASSALLKAHLQNKRCKNQAGGAPAPALAPPTRRHAGQTSHVNLTKSFSIIYAKLTGGGVRPALIIKESASQTGPTTLCLEPTTL